MAYNYSKLRGRIIEFFGTQARFAEEMGLSERTLSLKMNNRVPWKQREISKVIEILQLRDEDIQDYFFTLDVQSIEQLQPGA